MTHSKEVPLTGTFPALVTPFSEDGASLDLSSFRSLLQYISQEGVRGVVIGGSTGESPTLSENELDSLIECALKELPSSSSVIAGINSNHTAQGVASARRLESKGAHALLVVCPPYNKPTQEGLYAHFAALRSAVSIPLIAYNIPGRTGVKLEVETIARLARDGIISGLKDSTGALGDLLEVKSKVSSDFKILSGEDLLVLSVMAGGGSGVISASANLIPRTISQIVLSAERGDYASALNAQIAALPVVQALFLETNPIPVKHCLRLCKIIAHDTVRLPLTLVSKKTKAVLESIAIPE